MKGSSNMPTSAGRDRGHRRRDERARGEVTLKDLALGASSRSRPKAGRLGLRIGRRATVKPPLIEAVRPCRLVWSLGDARLPEYNAALIAAARRPDRENSRHLSQAFLRARGAAILSASQIFLDRSGEEIRRRTTC